MMNKMDKTCRARWAASFYEKGNNRVPIKLEECGDIALFVVKDTRPEAETATGMLPTYHIWTGFDASNWIMCGTDMRVAYKKFEECCKAAQQEEEL